MEDVMESSVGGVGEGEGLPDEAVTTVSELNQNIAERVESAENLHTKFIVGEVVDSGKSNGTLYFQLTDDDASIKCLVFSQYLGQIDLEFDDGMEIAVVGKVSYYEEKGNCSIFVHEAVSIGEGAYKKQLRELREKLTKEGLFEDDRKQRLPEFPETIGLATSAGSDAQEDFVNTVLDRYPDVDIVVHGTSVQGDRAAGDLEMAMQVLDSSDVVDVVVVTRGGGSEEDLRAFNEEVVVRAVASAETPVVVAIGHEMDQTVAGLAADRRAITPTNAGEVVVREKREVVEGVAASRDTVDSAFDRLVDDRVESLRNRVDSAFSAVETEYEHEQEVAATEQKYRRRVAVLIALLVAVLLLWWLL